MWPRCGRPHNFFEQRGRGGRESLCPIRNVRKPKPARNPSAPLSIGDEARSPSTRKASTAGASANGSSRARPNVIGRRPNPQRSSSLQQRKARRLNTVTEKQQNCTLRSPNWATTDQTPLDGRALPAAPSQEIQATKTCTRRCERKRRENLAIVSPLQGGNANTRSPLHQQPPAWSTNRVMIPSGSKSFPVAHRNLRKHMQAPPQAGLLCDRPSFQGLSKNNFKIKQTRT